eukprot:Tbor_TRINITY_DN4856_c0_g1::TRINITY_DN4856_c0_g1_i1::g.1420::m.1420
MLRYTHPRHFSPMPVNPVSSRPAFGPPRGAANRMLSMGLPPWAAWCSKFNRHARYRLSGIDERSFLPKPQHMMDVIYMNERVRERVRTSRSYRYVYKQNQYPQVRTGVHFSDALNHWVQVPMVDAAMYAIEKEGGIDNFITNRSGQELKSTYGERLRRHILVRQKEIKKNYVLEKHSRALAEVIEGELKVAMSNPEGSKDRVLLVLDKYGLDRKAFFAKLALELHTSRKIADVHHEQEEEAKRTGLYH